MTVPIDIGRDEARDAAERELAKPIYADDRPLTERILEWLVDRLQDVLDGAADVSPGGYAGLVALVVLLVLAVVAVRLRIGRVGRAAGGDRALFEAGPRSAAEHRAAADAHAGRGEWAPAVRERFRAVVRELEERDLLDARAGRTADEAAVDAGRALPACAADLIAAARLFDDVVYGDRPARQETDERIRAVDDAVRRARPTVPAG